MKVFLSKLNKNKICVICLIICTFLSILTWTYINNDKSSFTFKQQKIRLVSETYNEAIFKDSKDNILKVTIEKGDINSTQKLINVEYLDYYITYDSMEIFKKGIYIKTPDELISCDNDINTYLMEDTNIPIEKELMLNVIEVLEYDIPFILLVITQFIMFIVGIITIFYPEVLWHFKYAFVVDGGEPSEFYLFTSKIGGVIGVFIALIYPFIVIYT